jgi:hypothetical protein
MFDQSEPAGRRWRSGDPEMRSIAEREDSSSRDEAIDAVAELLSSKKEALARPSNQPPIHLADLSGSLGVPGHRLKNPPADRANVEMPGTRLDPPDFRFPDLSESHRSKSDEAPSDPPSPIVTSMGSQPATTDQASTSLNREVAPSQVEPTTKAELGLAIGDSISRDGKVSNSRLSVTVSHSIEHGTSGESSIGTDHMIDREAQPVEGTVPGSGSIRNERGTEVVPPPKNVAIPGISTFDQLRESEDSKNSSEALASPKFGTDRSNPAVKSDVRSGPTRSLGTSVRNPLSEDLRNFSMVNLSGSESGDPASSLGASDHGKAEASAGQSPSMSEGGAVDLTRTNDLLQQLIDAVRKQRSSSVPVGGSSVYPDR